MTVPTSVDVAPNETVSAVPSFSVSDQFAVDVVDSSCAAAIVKVSADGFVGVPVTLAEPSTVLPAGATIPKPTVNGLVPSLRVMISSLSPRMPTRGSTV